MEQKLLYSIGNFFTGYPFGVEAVRQFGVVEVHGPFGSENEANTYAHRLVETVKPDTGPFESVKVVKIETPQAGKAIVFNDGEYQYA